MQIGKAGKAANPLFLTSHVPHSTRECAQKSGSRRPRRVWQELQLSSLCHQFGKSKEEALKPTGAGFSSGSGVKRLTHRILNPGLRLLQVNFTEGRSSKDVSSEQVIRQRVV